MDNSTDPIPCSPGAHDPVLSLGAPVLRQVAQPVAAVADPVVQALIDRMLETVRSAHGVGLAAPQVGVSLRIVVVASRPNLRYPHAPQMAPAVLVNPQILAASDAIEWGWEGCLSVPDVRGHVPRHRRVEVEYLDRHGTSHRQVWDGFVARIVQHELDHLNGLVFLDRVTSEADLVSEEAYQTLEIAALPSTLPT